MPTFRKVLSVLSELTISTMTKFNEQQDNKKKPQQGNQPPQN